MEIKLEYRPHKNQKTLHDDPSRYKVVVAGRRFGKSVFARHHCLLNALFNPGLYWIISPTYRQSKQIHWMALKKEIPNELITYQNEQELSIHLANGSIIELKGADNEQNLRGVGLKGVVLDEAADQKPHVWEEIIRPMLVDSEGWAVFIGTPKGFNWFYELYMRGVVGSPTYDPEWKAFHFTSYDNPYLKKREIDKAKKEALRSKKEDTFEQEYMAEFKRYEGLIYKLFSRESHVVLPFEVPYTEGWDIYRAVDFGYGVNPTVCLWIAVSPDEKWYVIDEYYEVKDASDYHCGMILSKSANYQTPTATFCDPSNPMLRDDWGKKGVYMTAGKRDPGTNLREWVNTGIDIITEKMKVSLKDNKPTLFVFSNCTHFIEELESYAWEEPKDLYLNHPGRPKKTSDHGPDALRYFAISYMGNPDRELDRLRFGRNYMNVNEGLAKKWSI